MIVMLALSACGGPPPPVLGEIPPFTLTDQAGAAFTRDTLAGKVWVADFIFTSCPDICPVLSAYMAEVQAHYGDEPRVGLISFTVDPATDTPEVLATYGRRFDADPSRWRFLTGDATALRAVVVDGFKQAMEPIAATQTAPETILHGSRFVVVDGQGRLRAFPDPREPGKKELYAAVDALLRE